LPCNFHKQCLCHGHCGLSHDRKRH
jgi:hypothetical protein